MKIIKYIFTAVLIMIGLFLLGEYNVQRTLHSLESAFPHTSFNFGIDWKNAVDDIIITAERNNVIAFVHDYKFSSLYLLNFDVAVYSTHELPSTVTDLFGRGLQLRSLFRGEINISFHCIESIVQMPTSHFVYFYGSEDNVIAFIDDLSKRYEQTSGLHDSYESIIYRTIVLMYWVIAILLILFLTFVDMFMQKKEVLVRVMLGSSVFKFVTKNVIRDIVFYLLLFLVGCTILSLISSVMLRPAKIVLIFLTIICLNSSVFLGLYSIDFKQATSKIRIPKSMIRLSYIIMTVAVLFAISALASFLVLIQPLREHIKAHEFFFTHRDYYFANFQFKTPHNIDDLEVLEEVWRKSEIMNQTIYKELFNITQPMIISKVRQFDELTDFGIIYANVHALGYLVSVISGLYNKNMSEEALFIIPDWVCSEQKQEAIKFAQFTLKSYGAAQSYTVMLYESGVSVLSIDAHSTENEFVFISDPIVVLDTSCPTISVISITPFSGTVMHRFTDYILLELMERFALEYEIMEITNIYALFEHFWLIILLGVYSAATAGVLALVLASITIHRIISLEYTVNAIELCIKGILGYSIMMKNAETIANLLFMFILCFIVTVSVTVVLGGEINAVVLLPIAVLLLITTCVLLWSIRRAEKSQIMDILKGHIRW